jgi:hypothetical protein
VGLAIFQSRVWEESEHRLFLSMDEEYERHLEKLRALGYKEGFFNGLESAEKHTMECLGYVAAAKWYAFVRVLVEEYYFRRQHEMVRAECIVSENGLKNLLDVHTFSPENLVHVYDVDLTSFQTWDLYSCLASVLHDGKLSEEDHSLVVPFAARHDALRDILLSFVGSI